MFAHLSLWPRRVRKEEREVFSHKLHTAERNNVLVQCPIRLLHRGQTLWEVFRYPSLCLRPETSALPSFLYYKPLCREAHKSGTVFSFPLFCVSSGASHLIWPHPH